ncbi:MAG: hypothetical protein ACRDY7_11200, partial [Acidimicrobiia bacterium]
MGYHDHDHDVPARDPFVADALRSLPVPDRPADFLARLDDALDEVDAGRRPAQPVPLTTPIRTQEDPRGEIVPTDLTEATPGVADLDRRRHAKASRRYRALAAAASVALVVGAVALLTGDDGPTTT